MRAYKDLKPCARDQKAGEQPSTLEICAGHSLSVVEGLVCVDGKATTEFFEQAEEVEDCNVSFPLGVAKSMLDCRNQLFTALPEIFVLLAAGSGARCRGCL